MIFQHHRFQIWNKSQHPYSHSLTEFTYVNDALPSGLVQNAQQTLDWIIGVVYPNTKDAVATPAALPAAGNTINDYRVVNDDGDGKAAAYRWMQLEGDVSPEWKKIYDMDWGEQSVLSNFLTKTQDVYVFRYGIDDLDETGTAFAGDLAGQRIYGGQSANTHLTLFANSGDGVGAQTGFVQFGDNARPLVDSSVSLGTTTYRFLNFWADEINVATMQILGGSITDSSGAIDFDDENLSTSGTITSGTLLLQGGSITDSTGAISFGDEDLTTTGFIAATSATIGDFGISGNTIITTAASNLNIELTPDGTGFVKVNSDLDVQGDVGGFDAFFDTLNLVSPNTLETLDIEQLDSGVTQYTSTGTHIFREDATALLELSAAVIEVRSPTNFHNTPTSWFTGATEYLRVESGRIDSLTIPLTIDGAATLTLEASADVKVAQHLSSTGDNTHDLGITGATWKDFYLKGNITDDTNLITMTTLLSFRDALVGATAGMSLFYDGAKWNASIPDTEISHGAISNLLVDDHTQYMHLTGRVGGQILNGGTAASDNLVLESTTNATKGVIEPRSSIVPNSDGTLHLGGVGARFDDLYMAGEGIGFRLENAANFAALPAASASNIGRGAWVVDTETIYIDNGGVWKQITSDKYSKDETAAVWDGTNTSHVYTTSGDIDDARDAIWQFLDNTNGFRHVQGAVITKTQTQVTVTFTIPPASGTYRLVGVG